MDVDAAAAATGPFAAFLVAAAVVSGIAAWIGRRAEGQLQLLAGINTAIRDQLTEAWQERDAAHADAEAARAEARRTQEALEMAQADKRRAESSLADTTFRLHTVEAAMHELELQFGLPHRRSVDGTER